MFKRLVERGAPVAITVDGKTLGAWAGDTVAAALLAARAGLSTVLFDENPGIGGQIYRGITATPVTDRSILGEDYWAGEALAKEAQTSGAVIVTGATVWSLDPERIVGVSIAGK